MNRRIVIGMSLIGTILLSGCAPETEAAPQLEPWFAHRSAHIRGNGSPSKQQEAILRVLQETRQKLDEEFQALSLNSQPSDVAKMIAAYAKQLQDLPTTDCPIDVKVAHDRYGQDWKKLAEVTKRFPDIYGGSDFMDNLQLLFQGNDVRGRDLGGDMIDAVNRVTKDHQDLYDSAERHGVLSAEAR